ncbi:MAG TPA: PIN/TRAM domain-containing protein [Phycisphaerales bacterium]|nr:PIN/TRAM domain-containing protein [Phycisphaerales bacterium]
MEPAANPRPRAPQVLVTPGPAPDRSRMVAMLRGFFLVLLVIFTALIIVKDSATTGGLRIVEWWPIAVGGAILFFGGFVALDILTPKRKLSTISAVFVGLIAGIVVTLVLGTVIDLFSEIYGLRDRSLVAPLKLMLAMGICYLTISTVLQTQDDFRLVIPYVEFARRIRGPRPMVLDTSCLVDGRVLGVAEAGVFQAPLVVPRFVIEELHRLSDSADRLKRARGRRGLDAIARLQRSGVAEVSIEEATPVGATVDEQIVELARILPASVLTSDVGLSRIAAIRGVPVLNLNELANALKPAVIPGEPLTVELLRRGEQPGQAVGFLDDGTMVVADRADDLIGSRVALTVTSSTQTSAGRMIFGRLADRPADRPADPPRRAAAPAPGPEPEVVPESIEPERFEPAPTDSPTPPPISEPVDRPGPLGPGRFDRPTRAVRNPRRG